MSWLTRQKRRNNLTFHPGVYKFNWPYLCASIAPDEYNNVQIYTCEIEIHVGHEEDLKLDRIATIYVKAIKEGVGITNYFEDISTKIRFSFFDYIFYEHLLDEDLLTNLVRWIEYYPKEFAPRIFPQGLYKEVKMDWDNKKKRYQNPKWNEINEEHFVFEVKDPLIDQGDIFLAEFSLPNLSLQTQIRPVVIISKDNNFQTIVAPLTSNLNYKEMQSHILINPENSNLNRDSIILVEQARAIEKRYLKTKIGKLSKVHLDTLLNMWKTMFVFDEQSNEITPTDIRFEIGKTISLEEDNYYEFKDFSKSGNIVKTITNCVDEYVCSFLNSQGGRIFFGINNDRKIVGLKLSYKERDELKCSISSKLYNLLPSLDPTSYQIFFHNVFSIDKLNNEFFVVEIIVPKPLDEMTLFFTGGNESFVRVNGSKKKLNGLEIQDWIRRRMKN
nr:type II toxin-antitoxin system PemK/MazF family toxin [Cohnella sp. WQ 127256]